MTDPTLAPTPPSRAALTAVLVQAAEGASLLADRPVQVGDWITQRVDLANGWQFWVWWLPSGQLDRLWAAIAPDGAHWSYGCDRWPDWNAGPDALVLEPLQHLLTSEQRERLRQRLLTCSCWPEPDLPPAPPPPTREQLDALWSVELMAS